MKYLKQLAFCAALLTGAGTAAAVPVSTVFAEEELVFQGMKYAVEDGAVTITGYTDALPADVVIPAEIDGMPVTAIGEYAFAFYEGIKSVTFPDSITEIRKCAFSQCALLENFTLPPNITSLPTRAFAFCTQITSIVIPDGVTSIGYEAFEGCSALTDVSLPESVTEIGSWAFYITPWQKAKIQENPLVIVNHILIDGMNVQGDTVVPADVVRISSKAFYTANQLGDLTILNPECVIDGNADTISNAMDEESFIHYYTGTIRGYEGSNAQAYAEKYGYTFESLGAAPQQPEPTLRGDVDCSEIVDVSDAVLLARYLVEDKTAPITEKGLANADADASGKTDPDDVIHILRTIAKLV